jgi:hypothetical protein
MHTFSITQQLTLKEYRRLVFTMLYSHVGFVCITVLAAISLVAFPFLYQSERDEITGDSFFYLGLTLIVVALYYPVASWIKAGRLFRGNYRTGENITYELSEHGVATTGESFNSQYTWDKVYQVKILKKWVLIYHSRRAATMIKISECDQDNINTLKIYLKSRNFRFKKNW